MHIENNDANTLFACNIYELIKAYSKCRIVVHFTNIAIISLHQNSKMYVHNTCNTMLHILHTNHCLHFKTHFDFDIQIGRRGTTVGKEKPETNSHREVIEGS